MTWHVLREIATWVMLWVREIAGWGLLLLGLVIFYVVYDYCERRYIFEAWVALIMGIFVFRGGIHLLKVAVAARVCRQAQDQLYPAPGAPRKAPRSANG